MGWRADCCLFAEDLLSGMRNGTAGAGVLKAMRVRQGRVLVARRHTSRVGLDALALLAQAHRRLDALFAQAEQDARALPELQHAVHVHGRLEEELLHPVLGQVLGEPSAALLEDARREHAWLKVRLIELSTMAPPPPVLSSRLHWLRERLRKHVAIEERQLFSRARRALSRRRLAELGARLQTREDELNGGLYPG
jgi:hypothetical protein